MVLYRAFQKNNLIGREVNHVKNGVVLLKRINTSSHSNGI